MEARCKDRRGAAWQFENVSTSGALRHLRQRRTDKSEIATPHEMRFAMAEERKLDTGFHRYEEGYHLPASQ